MPPNDIDALKTMAAADPTNELAHFSLGRRYLEAGDRAGAEASLRRTLELNPRHSVAHKLLGQVLLDTARKDEAVETLRRGILIAHEKGEFQPRNQMQELLRSLGLEPPQLSSAARPSPTGTTGGDACQRCGKQNPRLDEPPFETPIGRLIHQRICIVCWREWLGMSIKVINEYRLNLCRDDHSKIYDQYMGEFLGIQPPG